MRKFLLITTLLIALSTSIVHAQDPCAIVFGEGTFEYVSCTDYLNVQREIPQVDGRIAMIQIRVNNIASALPDNADDSAWVNNTLATVEGFSAELLLAIVARETFIIEADLIESAVRDATDIPNWVISTLLIDTSTLQPTIDNWKALDSNIALLLSDLRTAQANLPPAEEESDKGEPPEIDTDNVQSLPIDPLDPLPDEREIVATAVAVCQDSASQIDKNACIFQIGWTAMTAVELCNEPDAETGCFEAASQTLMSITSPGSWLHLIELYGAADDPIAALAVIHCQLNPATNEAGEPVPMGNCAQIEYFNLLDAVENPLSDLPDEPEDAEIVPLTGIWTTAEAEYTCDDGSFLPMPALEFVIEVSEDTLVMTHTNFLTAVLEFSREANDRFISSDGFGEYGGELHLLAPDQLIWEFNFLDCTVLTLEANLLSQ